MSGNQGGGVFNDRFALTVLDGCTIAENLGASADRSGVTNWDVIYLHNTILADNSPANCANPVFSLGYNLDADTSCDLNGAADLAGSDPMLGPLADNGGPTWTHLLPADSPAVDAGDPASFFGTDQRGISRPADGDFDGHAAPDIGSVEFVDPIFGDGFETGDTSAWEGPN